MKKIISVVLSAVIVLGVMSVAVTASASDDELHIAVASDLHYNQPREVLDYDIDDPVYFYGNRRAAMEDESGFIIDEFLKECAEDDTIEYVLISGDLADNGRTDVQEHYEVAAKLKAFEDETGKPVYICNGNHDSSSYGDETTNETFREIYRDFGYDEAIDTDEGTLSYTVNLGDKYRLIVADSCDPSVSTEDGFTQDRVTWVCDMAEKAYDEGRYPILMMHHNLLDHMPLQRVLSHNFIVRNHTLTAERLANAGIKTVFTGHEHGSDVISYTSTTGNVITDFSTTSLTMYPLAYRDVVFKDDEITYTEKKIESIDTDALTSAVSGYTDEQISLMNEDLDAYAKGFFKAGIKYRLTLSMSREKLGIDEDAFYADIVFTAVDGLLELMEMPLYGENSVQELAREYNIDIPDSSYENGWDVATEVVSYHYAGNEPYALDSTEITLILRIADLLLLDDLSTVNDSTFLSAANALISYFGTDSVCKDFTKAAANTVGPVTAGEYLVVAIASPILYGLAYDRDDLDDNNGSIDGYGVNNNSENISNNVSGIFSRIMLYISMFFRYFLAIFRIG